MENVSLKMVATFTTQSHFVTVEENYTSIGPKQQQSMLQQNSGVIKNWSVAPEKRKKKKGKKRDKRRNRSPKPGGTGKSWWNIIPLLRKETEEKKDDKRWNPQLEPGGTRNHDRIISFS